MFQSFIRNTQSLRYITLENILSTKLKTKMKVHLYLILILSQKQSILVEVKFKVTQSLFMQTQLLNIKMV